MKKFKRRLSETEEFQIMKIVLDKFLWIGAILMLFGFYVCVSKDVSEGLWFIASGAGVMIVFAWIVIKEFERSR